MLIRLVRRCAQLGRGLDSAGWTPGYWGQRSQEGVHDGEDAPALPAGLPGRGGRTGPDERARYPAATAGTPPRRSVMGFAHRPPIGIKLSGRSGRGTLHRASWRVLRLP